MTILFLTENFPPEENAAASRVYERACYWVQWGHDVTVLTTAPNFPDGKVYAGYRNRWYNVEEMDGIRVVRVKSFITPNRGTVLRLLDFVSFMCTSLVAGLFQKKPDVIAATSPQIFTAASACVLSGLRRVPFVFELADLWPESVTAVGLMKGSPLISMAEKLELFLYLRSSAVVSLTKAFKENLVRRKIPAQKIAVVINGVDLERYQPMPKDPALLDQWDLNGCFTVGYIGTHGMAHGLGNVLDASELLPLDSDVRFLMVGRGAEKEFLLSESRRRGLDKMVFVPAQTKENVREYWSLCDVALIHLRNSPTFATVIPSKTFEAMGMGIPLVVVAPEGEVRRIVEQEGAGVGVDAGDPEQLAAAVMALRSDGDRCRRHAEASLSAAQKYSREAQATGMMRVLEAVAQRGL